MAGNRIRCVRPHLIEHPKFAPLSDGAKALWLDMLPLWDDGGRSLGSVAYVHGRTCFANKKRRARVAHHLAELEQAGWLNRYQVDGVDYMAVNGWDDPEGPTYQFIKDKRTSKLPAPTSDSRTDPRTDDVSESRTDARSLEGEGDREGEREQEGEGDVGRSRGSGGTPPHPLPVDWVPEDSEANHAAADKARARGVDIDQQLANLRDHALEGGKKNRDWNARWRRWLASAHAAPLGNGQRQEQIRKIPTLSPMPRRDPRRPAQPESVPDDAVTVDPQGNARDAGPFVALRAELDRRGEP